ncbi:MAG: hypothetical protein HC906_08900 [Bacteroidales bacterium]|nr:hypothetical protein [Bacteroidales bacterium]
MDSAYNFIGPVTKNEMFRQSPHDVNAWIVKSIPMQPVPMVAVKTNTGYSVAVSSSPCFYNNFTSQEFDIQNNIVKLNSGDDGSSPGTKPDTSQSINLDYNADKSQKFSPGKIISFYHPIGKGKKHVFECLIFDITGTDKNSFRKKTTLTISKGFSKGKFDNYFGSLAFVTAYMNLRVNETGKSRYWVVPAIEYSNIQYTRDAFWISTVLDPFFSNECLKTELHEVNHFAEYPLVAIIWAYRAYTEGMDVDLKKVQDYVNAVEKRARNNCYYSYFEGDGRLDFQYWGDVIAFEKDDVISYNQGLFALAIDMAARMKLQIISDPEEAANNYRNIYRDDEGFLPISRKKRFWDPIPSYPIFFHKFIWEKKCCLRTWLKIIITKW